MERVAGAWHSRAMKRDSTSPDREELERLLAELPKAKTRTQALSSDAARRNELHEAHEAQEAIERRIKALRNRLERPGRPNG